MIQVSGGRDVPSPAPKAGRARQKHHGQSPSGGPSPPPGCLIPLSSYPQTWPELGVCGLQVGSHSRQGLTLSSSADRPLRAPAIYVWGRVNWHHAPTPHSRSESHECLACDYWGGAFLEPHPCYQLSLWGPLEGKPGCVRRESQGRQVLSPSPRISASLPTTILQLTAFQSPSGGPLLGECAGGVAPTPGPLVPWSPPTSGGSRGERGEQAPICPQPTLLRQRLCLCLTNGHIRTSKAHSYSPAAFESPLNCVFKNPLLVPVITRLF